MKQLSTVQTDQVAGGNVFVAGIAKKQGDDNDRLRSENKRLKRELRNARKKDPKVKAHKERNTPQGT